MGRIRSIKPEAPQSESLGRVSRDARLLFFMLFTVVDDDGRCRASPEWPFDEFWNQYPHKVGKQDALKAFRRVERKGVVSFEDLMGGLARYVAKTDDRPWCNPGTWLNQGRWEDQPAPAQQPH